MCIKLLEKKFSSQSSQQLLWFSQNECILDCITLKVSPNFTAMLYNFILQGLDIFGKFTLGLKNSFD